MSRKFSSVSISMCTIWIAFAAAASAQTEAVIHSFQSTSVFDGIAPYSGLVADKNGALYGTTVDGGNHVGTVYKLAPPAVQGEAWKQTVLYSFAGGSDGANPSGALVVRPSGKIYGTTQRGGGSESCGVVYELAPPTKHGSPWTQTVLYTFCSSAGDGDKPIAGLISGEDGRLYGTTYKGGKYKAGNVFLVAPPAHSSTWVEEVLCSFKAASDGTLPSPGGLAMDTAGALYGVLQSSEQDGFNPGLVFQLVSPIGGRGPWTENVLYSFGAQGDGYGPVGSPVFDQNGVLYGATFQGGQNGAGSVFALTPPRVLGGAWTETVLYSFTGGGDGSVPDSSLALDGAGAIYGVTEYGGSQSCGGTGEGCGVAFKLTPPATQGGAWTNQTLHGFLGGLDGESPIAPVLPLGGTVYGTTAAGGTGYCGNSGEPGCGTVFQIQ
jgi:hypothetical protein